MATAVNEAPSGAGKIIAEALSRSAHTQTSLARQVGITQGAISQIILGTTKRSKYLPDIARALGVDLSELLAPPSDRRQRPAPRMTPSPLCNPLAVSAAKASRREGGMLRRFIKAIEPWYDWGGSVFERLDGEGEGDGRFFSLEWFGLHITIFYGRQPAKAVR